MHNKMNDEQVKNAVEQLMEQHRSNKNDRAVVAELSRFGHPILSIADKVRAANSKQAVQDFTTIDLDLRKSLKDLKEIVLDSL